VVIFEGMTVIGLLGVLLIVISYALAGRRKTFLSINIPGSALVWIHGSLIHDWVLVLMQFFVVSFGSYHLFRLLRKRTIDD